MRRQMATDLVTKYYKELTQALKNDCSAEDAAILKACAVMYNATKEEVYKDTVVNYLDGLVATDGTISGLTALESLSQVSIGNAIVFAYDVTGDEKYKLAAIGLNKLMVQMPRYNNVFVYNAGDDKAIKLAGYREAMVFYMLYETRFGGKEHYNDVIVQFKQARNLLFDEDKKIYYAAYEGENKAEYDIHAQADYMMALIDTLSVMDQPIYEYYNDLKSMYKEAVQGLLPYQNKENMYFYDAVTGPCKCCQNGCFTGTAQVLYTILKASRLKAILAEKYDEVAEATFASLCDNLDDKMASGFKVKAMTAFMYACAEWLMRQ